MTGILSGEGASDFLLEIRSEEIPARMQAGARKELENLFRREMTAAGVDLGEIKVWSTPRRLALIAQGLPEATEAVREEAKGPPEGAPDKAIDGFCRKNGVTKDQLELRDVKGRMTYFAVIEKPGRAMKDLLAGAIVAIIRDFAWPKSQRWGAASISTESTRWVRPLSGIVALFGNEVVECEVGDIRSGNVTRGHRFHSSGDITITDADDYAGKLRAAHVIVDHEERADLARAGARKAAETAGLTLVEDEGLVIENAGLTEWPVPLLGRFDEEYLDVPPEVIQLTARVNQKYFVCEDKAGKLANAFICTANIDAADPSVVVDGNRKVLAARLSDARFFWELDQKKPLAEHAEGLKRITFHEKLGTVADKVERVAKLARWLCEEGIVKPSAHLSSAHSSSSSTHPNSSSAHPELVEGSEPVEGSELAEESGPVEGKAGETDRISTGSARAVAELADMAEQAARLCKADLVTEMVGEFPELQGLMGGYYAEKEGLPQEVSDAIRDHYKPVGQGDKVPTAPVTVAVSLADKLDTLRSFFAIDEKPTGSKDPFALRRAALGAIRIIETNQLRLKLDGGDLLNFFADRLKVQQREAGVRHDLIDAVFALGGEDDLVRLLARVKALQSFIDTEDGANLLAGYKRAANILKKEEWSTKSAQPEPVEGSDLDAVRTSTSLARADSSLSYTPEAAEKALMDALDKAGPEAEAAVAAEKFAEAMAALATLRQPIDRFFDEVTVNAEEEIKRTTRLELLARFRAAVHKVADFSRIEG